MSIDDIVEDMFELFEKITDHFDASPVDQTSRELVAELYNKFCKLHN